MLELLATAAFFALINISLIIVGYKLGVWVFLKLDPCFFCISFWLCCAEHIALGLLGFVPIYFVIPVALASAGLAAFLFQFIDMSRS